MAPGSRPQARESPLVVSSEVPDIMMRHNPDPYLVLGVSPTATQGEITHAYRTRLRAQHPDTRRTPDAATADEELRNLLAAYALLRDPARRADYDRATGRGAPPEPDPPGAVPVAGPSTGPAQIPIRFRHTPRAAGASPPLRAGPVRRHR
ncbi:J domain-containing protein [Mycolicibacterium fortuitum]|uniref:J domain-containing protein n=1 Tax=Mycolicibacterium fortuitum TaxID=1766 RepID=UPI0039B047BF